MDKKILAQAFVEGLCIGLRILLGFAIGAGLVVTASLYLTLIWE